MSNILNHNRVPFTTRLNFSENWDFHLSTDITHTTNIDWFEKCLLCTFSFQKNEENNVYGNILWDEAVNNGLTLYNIGYTGVDNGIVTYKKDRISNTKFLEKFLNSTLSIKENDMRLILRKINGNNKIFNYDCDLTQEDGFDVIKCNGGFYQGFWKTNNETYQLLPDINIEGMSFEIELKPTDIENDNFTLNKKHPLNKGIFLYLGVRSENKWWRYYKNNSNFDLSNNIFYADDYILKEYQKPNIPVSYITDTPYEKLLKAHLDKFGYINSEYIKYPQEEYQEQYLKECKNYFNDDYIQDEIPIDENSIISDGDIPLNKHLITQQIETDNKFLLFDRTDDGFTCDNWEENTKLVIEQVQKPNLGNYFLLFNRGCDGYTIDTIDKLYDDNIKEYNIHNDLYNNAIAFQVNEVGQIGYKYLVKDCESNNYQIKTQFTKDSIIEKDKWSKILIKIIPTNNSSNKNTMILKIYVNNKLKLISNELPLLDFRKLNDVDYKQESIPFNISIGGGTQGLCDVVYPNYNDLPEFILPLEKEFGGSFIGYIKSFNIYKCI